jgi:DNA-binding CsgD family transcriptional regulator
MLAGFPEDLPPEAPVNGAAMIGFGRAVARRAAGDYAGALAAAEQVARLGSTLAIDSPTWASWRPLAIDPLRALGRLDEARELAAEQLDLSQRSEVPHLIGEAFCLAGGVSADREEAIALAGHGVEILTGTASRLRAGIGLLTLGSLLRRSGRTSDARKHLRAAVEVLVACGAVPTAEFARDELVATGARRGSTDPRQLTPSERRVAELAVAGLGNRAIAARLHVSRKTVETHLSSVYRKLELSSREQLIAHWQDRT